MKTPSPSIELDPGRLLGFDRLASDALDAGRLCDPRAAMVGAPKPPPPTDDDIQAHIEFVLSDPRRAEVVCGALAERIRAEVGEIDVVATVAVGGVVAGYEVARRLGVPFACFEHGEDGLAPRRGVGIAPAARCVVVDDTVRSGQSLRECVEAVRSAGGRVRAAACLVAVPDPERDTGVPLLVLEEDREAFARRAGELDAA